MAWNTTTAGVTTQKGALSVREASGASRKFTADLAKGASKRQRQYTPISHDEAEEDDSIDLVQKKRRLTADQIQFLEMSFNQDLKLEPERKTLIAKRLGLRPRQVAIWFQNRRARWKNKQVEQDFDALKAKYDEMVQENAAILKENQVVLQENNKLQEEVDRVKSLLKLHNNQGTAEVINGIGPLTPEKSLDSGCGVMKVEHTSAKYELTSPAISLEDRNKVQDSGQSCCARCLEATATAVVDLYSGELDSVVTCSSLRLESEHPAYAVWGVPVKSELEYQAVDASDEFYGNMFSPFLFQPLAANGVIFEGSCNLVYNWEDQFQHGYAQSE